MMTTTTGELPNPTVRLTRLGCDGINRVNAANSMLDKERVMGELSLIMLTTYVLIRAKDATLRFVCLYKVHPVYFDFSCLNPSLVRCMGTYLAPAPCFIYHFDGTLVAHNENCSSPTKLLQLLIISSPFLQEERLKTKSLLLSM
jgi:hypothetical protein